MSDVLTAVLGTAVAALGAWVFNTNSKVDVTDQRVSDLKEKIEGQDETLQQLMEVQFEAMNARLGRIETALNGALKGH